MSEKTIERRTAEGRVLKANNLKFKVIVVTNQAGIGKNLYSENDFISLNNRVYA